MDICLYCKKGKALNISEFGDVSIKTYIHGNLLVTEAFNYRNDKDDFSAMKINVCPICKEELEELQEDDVNEEEVQEIELMGDNEEFMQMLNNEVIDPEEIMDKYGGDCPSCYGLQDDMNVCRESGDGCESCWENAIHKYREEVNNEV